MCVCVCVCVCAMHIDKRSITDSEHSLFKIHKDTLIIIIIYIYIYISRERQREESGVCEKMRKPGKYSRDYVSRNLWYNYLMDVFKKYIYKLS